MGTRRKPGFMPYRQRARGREARTTTTAGLVSEALAGATFPCGKVELAGRAGDKTIPADDGRPLSLRQIVDEAPVERFASLAEVVELAEDAVVEPRRPHAGAPAPSSRPHA